MIQQMFMMIEAERLRVMWETAGKWLDEAENEERRQYLEAQQETLRKAFEITAFSFFNLDLAVYLGDTLGRVGSAVTMTTKAEQVDVAHRWMTEWLKNHPDHYPIPADLALGEDPGKKDDHDQDDPRRAD